ncbi:hypothetical protein HYX09_05885 [Candidatus Woesearchaeota archaeon]|nr:hypothetical protein [Candidatus Woesearchaeota archaeon]
MFIDIVFPENNERDFLSLAEHLGITATLCYPYGRLPPNSGNCAVLADSNRIGKIRNGAGILLCNSSSREVFESRRPVHIFGMELFPRNDSMHTRHSGMNHILAASAHENGHTICFSPATLQSSNNPGFSVVLGRMMQNVTLCRKFKIRMKLASLAGSPYKIRAEKEMESFGMFLGMSRKEAKEALSFA